MPSKLDIPSVDDIGLLDSIIAERRNPNKTFFEGYQSDWVSRYGEYEDNNGNPEMVSNSTIASDDKNKFINLYEKKLGIINIEIIDKLRYQNLTFCPFCSEAGTPMTLDHYLPKSEYPEYSILSTNLIPMCDACQRADAKGTKVLNERNERLFLHPYYDDIENEEILKLTILPPYERGVNFELFVNDSIDEELRAVCQRHVDNLNIDYRFRIYFSSQYERLKKLVRNMKKQTFSQLILVERLEYFYEERKIVGINYWDTVFYKSVLSNADLLDYLTNYEFQGEISE